MAAVVVMHQVAGEIPLEDMFQAVEQVGAELEAGKPALDRPWSSRNVSLPAGTFSLSSDFRGRLRPNMTA